MILKTLRSVVHLVLIFSMVSLNTQNLWAMDEEAGGVGGMSQSRPFGPPAPLAEALEEEYYPPGTLEALRSSNPELARRALRGFLTLKNTSEFFGSLQYALAAVVYTHDPNKYQGDGNYRVDPIKFLQKMDVQFFKGWCEEAREGNRCQALARKKNILELMGNITCVGAVPFVVTATYAIGDFLDIPLDGPGEAIFILTYLATLAPTLSRIGFERAREIYYHFKGRGFPHKGNEYNDVPKIRGHSKQHKVLKWLLMAGCAVYALGPVGVFALLGENQGKPPAQQNPGDRTFSLIFGPAFEIILAEMYYTVGNRALNRFFQRKIYNGAESTEAKRRIFIEGFMKTRAFIASDSRKAKNAINTMYSLLTTLVSGLPSLEEGYQPSTQTTKYLSVFSLLLMRWVDPTVDFGDPDIGFQQGTIEVQGEFVDISSVNFRGMRARPSSEASPLLQQAEALLAERDDFAMRAQRARDALLGMDILPQEDSIWKSLCSRVTSIIMGVQAYFGFRVLEYITEGLLISLGMSEKTSVIVANIFTAIATGAVTFLTWDEINSVLSELPKFFNRNDDFWGLRLPFKLNTIFHATIMALSNIVAGRTVFANDPAPARYFLLGTAFVGQFALFVSLFDRGNKGMATALATGDLKNAHTVRRRRAVLNYYIDRAIDLVRDGLDPFTVEQLFTYLLEHKPPRQEDAEEAQNAL